MKYVNIMGPTSDMDRVVSDYISEYEIQLEYTMKELVGEKGLQPFTDPNPYTEILRKAEKFVDMIEPNGLPTEKPGEALSENQAINIIRFAEFHFDKLSNDLTALRKRREEYIKAIAAFEPYRNLEFDVKTLQGFSYIGYEFGKIPINGFKQFEAFLYNDAEVLFVAGKMDGNYLWCAYFAVQSLKDKVDSVFSSLHFEKLPLPQKVNGRMLEGTPDEICTELGAMLSVLERTISENEKRLMRQADLDETVKISIKDIVAACEKLRHLAFCHDMRRYAAKTVNDFYIFVGWMPSTDAEKLSDALKDDERVVMIVESDNDTIVSVPPTKLKNRGLFKPFEFFVSMYGLPSYGEIDPTPFVAVTYTLLFGIMFGDAGQGAVLSLLGMFLWKKKGLALGRILSIIGCSSVFFGLLFGSVFGWEFKSLWHPLEFKNQTLLIAVAMGSGIILTSMAFNIANAVRQKKITEILLHPSGFAGMLFYASALIIAVSVVLGTPGVMNTALIALIVISVFFIALRTPITKIMRKEKRIVDGSVPLFALETFIELFEVMLGYFTNTVSFVRVGAFALSHASMMGVVWMLSETAGGSKNIAVIIFGNLLVIALEGLIAGIQVLRLEFYEMFSRFYGGEGRAFTPLNKGNGGS